MSSRFIVTTLDAHSAGEPLRLITGGYPSVEGGTMLERRAWLRAHHDDLRTALMLEPRGHADMYGALLTPPERATSDAGVLFMHNQGYSTMCGHGIIAVVSLALEHGLILPRHPPMVVLDTPAGQIHATAVVAPGREPPRVTAVSFRNVPSFVLRAGVPVPLGARTIRADIAFGGAFYAVVDSESAGIPLTGAALPELRRAGMAIARTIEQTSDIAHPAEPALAGVYGTIFTGPPASEGADLRNVTVFADAEVDRSPCGTGTCAVMAVLAAMELLQEGQTFTHESLIGTRFRGRIAGRTAFGDVPAIVPVLEGSAYLTGRHEFVLDAGDPLRDGFRLERA